ncbi:putative siderophore transport system ATP-binding protein YusV [Burkholderia thailandensis MSMB121]|uniref:ABC transporter ATP-binding protein n=2 Tax=Burkholderia humptydooensis TaxID=430531 RepID=A0A7U4PB70_9BURK|nr:MULTISPECIES: ABC transporter ATP-binding protein [Burkholderia]AGK50266.1 putative siderophore transport system ATP-binding protein YusV [Burkholderia thailandensis MSMB121]ATF33260.1 ABC transporter ATP-binding protein [Burkholderia thailandensis]AJY39062.1 ABC transporter family protein [Burkholderia sp. 2002721687]ALX46302.1 iron dicitrate ABC transporter ATP-binding protein [Burkholderia humptydooensis]EIP84675.1 ferrichrome ABC superfamily ATP binding cassette transporter, ABC protein
MTLVAHNLSLGYGPRRIVDSLSLSIESGRITVLLGPNGSGKSTLLRALAGLLAPRGGDALLDDVSLRQWPRRKLARRVAFLAQAQDIPSGLTVQELVRHGRFAYRTWLRGETDDDREAVEWALEMTGLVTMRDRSLVALSGGERQRVWIAMALAQRADILLLDEPTTYLDLGHQLDVMQTLRRLNEEFGLTLVMSLHDLNQAMRFADRAIVMRDGRLVADGAPVDVLTPAFVADVFHVRSERLHGASDGVPVCHPLGYAAPGGDENGAGQAVRDAVPSIGTAGDD